MLNESTSGQTAQIDIDSADLSVGKTRREAIAAFVGVAITGAAACMGCNQISGQSAGQTPVGGGTAPSAATGAGLGSITQMKASGAPVSVTANGGPAFVEFSTGSPVVLSATCPHRGCPVAWNAGQSEFICPCHGSVFGENGSRVSGVAQTALTVIKSHVTGDTLYADT